MKMKKLTQKQSNLGKTATRWMNRLLDTDTPWSENEIIYFRKAIGSCGLKDSAERVELQDAFSEDGYRISYEQDMKGKNYILSNSLKKNGEMRKGSLFTKAELSVFENLSHHLFVGVHNASSNSFNSFLPVYKAIDNAGNSVTYVGNRYEGIVILESNLNPKAKLRLV